MTTTTFPSRRRTTRSIALPARERRRIGASLERMQLELDEQMRAASATLEEIRQGFSLTDPDIQAPLMTALHSLDSAEHAAIDVADAQARLEAGTYGVCGRCGEDIPVERLELRPAGRFCVSCSR